MNRARSSLRWGLAAAIIAAASAVAPAAPAAVSGSTTLVLSGPAAKALRAKVEISPQRPARGSARRIELPLRAGLAGASTTVLFHRGGIVLRRGSQAARLTRLRLVLGKRSRVRATIAGRELSVFTVPGGDRATVDSVTGTVRLGGAKLRLTRAGAKAIAAQLNRTSRRGRRGNGRPKPPIALLPGHLGGIATHAAGLAATGGTKEDGGGGEAAAGCPLPSGAGPAPEDPLPVASPPPGASSVAGATLEWHARESFIRYIATGEGTSVSDGATAGPPALRPGASRALTYDFGFPFASGWHDDGANPADPADDSAAIHFGGAVRFLYSGHEIDLALAQPEIEIDGPASRAVFAISEDGGPAQRQVLVNLDLSRAGAISVAGDTHTYERVPGAIPSGTAGSTFAGFYAPGAEFGCFDLAYTTP